MHFPHTLLTLVLLSLCFFADTARGDKEAEPRQMVVASGNGAYIFKMLPSVRGIPVGIACEFQEDGQFAEIWRTEGWYASAVFLSNDGRYLVRMGEWARGKEPDAEDLAVAFYDRGKLLRQYSTTDLVKDKTKVRSSVHHYIWLASDLSAMISRSEKMDPLNPPPALNYWKDHFHIKTCDGLSYTFSIKTGEITECVVGKPVQ